jgi:uncharacterized oligopeptide transporter (OPT) family protein
VFDALVGGADAIGNDKFPAPAAQTWKGVAEAMTAGISHLHPVKSWSIAVGGAVGLLLPLLSHLLGKRGKYVPSAAGVGLAWTFHFHFGLSFAIGALIAWIWTKISQESSEEFLFVVASGIITAAALTGVGLVFFG